MHLARGREHLDLPVSMEIRVVLGAQSGDELVSGGCGNSHNVPPLTDEWRW